MFRNKHKPHFDLIESLLKHKINCQGGKEGLDKLPLVLLRQLVGRGVAGGTSSLCTSPAAALPLSHWGQGHSLQEDLGASSLLLSAEC